MTNRLAIFRASDGYARWDRWLAWPLVALGLVFLVVLILPFAAPLTTAESNALDVANWVIWAAFAVDYLARLYLALERRAFVRGHVLDLVVVVVPFLRPLRLLRLVAIVVSTTRRAGGLVVRQVTLYVVALAVIIASVCAVIVYDSEHDVAGSSISSLGDAFWWALATVTTVGYGDEVPQTTTGQIVAGVLMVTGIALVGTLTAAVASWFVNIVRASENAPLEARAEDERAALHEALAALTTTVEGLRTEVAALRLEGTATS
jgi:voltage-gated potassium channel